MNPEIVKFYADRQLHISKLINKRPADVAAIQVEIAAEKVYSQIQTGYKIKTLNIARYVWQVARGVNADAYMSEQEFLQNYKKIITEKNLMIDSYSVIVKRCYIYSLIAAALAVGLVIQEVLCIL